MNGLESAVGGSLESSLDMVKNPLGVGRGKFFGEGFAYIGRRVAVEGCGIGARKSGQVNLRERQKRRRVLPL
ncbi:MAG: hypothetical protein DMF63_09360 [Acidobacteria bacterium]|nr:MAG: hypothetical protein DMF63_09360 [Acidobacteriota bacterium]